LEGDRHHGIDTVGGGQFMHLRFVHLKVKEGRFHELRTFYDQRVIPAMQETKGCLFASLMQPTDNEDEYVSMTLWTSRKRAEEYEASGLYDQLLDASDDFLAEASEWRVQLKGDPGHDVPRLQEPQVEEYPVEIAVEGSRVDESVSPHLFVRIVAMRIQAGRFEELRERYNEVVVPALLETPGCLAVFLVEGIRATSRALSVTVWDNEEKAVRYEMSGAFDKLVGELSEFFSGLYQWKLSLAPSREGDEVSGRDLDVSGYHVITGRRLRG
jgi:heme-degrading monooxygenase HmoA